MDNLNIIRETTAQEYEKILFERPISQMHARNIGMLAGRHARLKHTNDMYEIISLMHHHPVLIAEPPSSDIVLPADVMLIPSKGTSRRVYTNTDEALQRIGDCEYMIVGIEFELNSLLQLFIEQIVTARHSPIVFTDDAVQIARVSPEIFVDRQDDIYVCSYEAIVRLANILGLGVQQQADVSVLNKLILMRQVAVHLSARIVIVSDIQMLAIDYRQSNSAVITNFTNPSKIELRGTVIAILTSLLSDNTNDIKDFLVRVATTSYLLRESLNNKSDIRTQLKKLLQ